MESSKQQYIDIFIRKTKNAEYKTKYGIAFECVN